MTRFIAAVVVVVAAVVAAAAAAAAARTGRAVRFIKLVDEIFNGVQSDWTEMVYRSISNSFNNTSMSDVQFSLNPRRSSDSMDRGFE